MGIEVDVKSKKLPRYAGPLNVEEVSTGIKAAQKNAIRLLEDAKLLFEHARFPSATALAILAIEERGKVNILKRLAVLEEEAHLREAWRAYRNHRAKNAGWIIESIVASGARTMMEMKEAVNPDGEHAALLDNLKQIAFYSDCLGQRNWSEPENVIDKECARSTITSAERMWNAREVTRRELELWVSMVRPHYMKPGMIAAVTAYQEAMYQEGLSDTRGAQLLAFI